MITRMSFTAVINTDLIMTQSRIIDVQQWNDDLVFVQIEAGEGKQTALQQLQRERDEIQLQLQEVQNKHRQVSTGGGGV